MRNVIVCCLGAAIVLAWAASAGGARSSAAAVPRQTKQRAERNLLAATRMLARWRVGLIDPKTGLLRSNTTATCSGKGTAVAHAYRQFTCVLRYRTVAVRLLYIVQSKNGFEVRRLSRR